MGVRKSPAQRMGRKYRQSKKKDHDRGRCAEGGKKRTECRPFAVRFLPEEEESAVTPR